MKGLSQEVASARVAPWSGPPQALRSGSCTLGCAALRPRATFCASTWSVTGEAFTGGRTASRSSSSLWSDSALWGMEWLQAVSPHSQELVMMQPPVLGTRRGPPVSMP